MARIVQCVPNFSEGRDIEKIEKIVGVFQNTTGYKMVSYEPDADYNRTVVTLLGDPDAIIEGMLNMFQEALTLIDMNHHKGEH